jgi:hypothetical protein
MSYLHVINGSALLEPLRAAGIPGTFVEYSDVLHEGPVMNDDDMAVFLYVRAEFIAECGWGRQADVLRQMQQWQAAITAFRDYDDVILWYEHDLFDQLLLIRHLNWWWRNAPMDPPSLVSPAEYLGPQSPARLEALFQTRGRVTEAQLTLAADVWQAFTGSDPRELVRIFQIENTSALPHLQRALLRLLEEYPSTYNGLGRTEQQAIEICAQAPLTASDLFAANARREERVFMGDTTFFMRLQRLLDGPHPLLERKLEDAPLQLTGDGRRVLDGVADAITLNGIDRWIGGVRLTAESHWRWNGKDLAFAGSHESSRDR